MAWFKADDGIMQHPKFMAAEAQGGFSTIGVWFAAGTWANSQMTDGFIPRSWVMLKQAESEALVLVDVGLWHEDASRDGWQMHDYADYQPLKADLEAKSQQKRSAGQAGGKQSASRRQANVKQARSEREANVKPVPEPEPEPVTPLRGVSARRISPKTERNLKRLGIDPTNGDAA